MANKQIYQLTETLSVSPDDWLAIDLDSSNVTRKARVGNVFSVSEGSSYTGGTANGIMFNDGNTFTTDANLTWDGSALGAGDISFRPLDSVPSIQGIYFKGTTGSNWQIAANSSVTYIGASNNVQIWSAGIYRGSVQAAGWHIGDSQISPSAKLHTTLSTDVVGHRLDLSNGQTADAFQINSYGNTGGDLARIMSNGNIVLNGDTITDSTVIDVTSPPSSSVVRHGVKVTSTGNSNSTYYAFYANVTGSTPYSFYAASGRAFINGTLDLNYNSLLNVGNTKFIGVPSTQYGNLLVSDESDFSAGSGGQLVFGGNPVGQTGYRAAYGIIKGVKENSTYNNNLGGLSFHTNNQASGYLPLLSTLTERMRINSDGNVGIGTSSPSAKFHTNLSTDIVGYRLDLSNGQTADAFQINSYGNTGGDLFNISASGSVGIGTSSPDASAITEMSSTTKGMLIPRMTTTQRDAIASPATGLLIFNTTTVKLEYYSGTAWGQV